MDFRVDTMFIDMPRLSFVANTNQSETSIYRMCICNTTFLLLRSFAHQLCPLC